MQYKKNKRQTNLIINFRNMNQQFKVKLKVSHNCWQYFVVFQIQKPFVGLFSERCSARALSALSRFLT